ncbi:IS110 family transposase [Rhizobium esperanzae]|uniref:IS110 family transposase n=1 Tax=Rhizobium esperanzae TaxID=1967781 RepID=UPI001FD9A71E|nr:transposase [Rhizobium esperanzae]
MAGCHLHPLGESRRFSNDKTGIGQLKRLLARHRPERIVMEATGKFHRPAHRSLWLDGFAVAAIDPLRARMFARACGYLAKTDRLDARFLALLAESLRPPAGAPPSPHIEALQELVNARSAAIGDITALQNRSKTATTAVLRGELNRFIRQLEQHVDRLDKEIERCVGEDPQLCRKPRSSPQFPASAASPPWP